MIAEIERTHMERFRGLYDTMKDGHIFVKEEDTVWRCMECGHIYIGKKTTINVKGSPDGVITADSTNSPTIAYLLYLLKNDRVKSPMLDNIHDNKGNSKTTPIIKIIVRKLPIYESREI